jgi:hypothetical protein
VNNNLDSAVVRDASDLIEVPYLHLSRESKKNHRRPVSMSYRVPSHYKREALMSELGYSAFHIIHIVNTVDRGDSLCGLYSPVVFTCFIPLFNRYETESCTSYCFILLV